MGQIHPEGELPFQVLSGEGFEPDEFIDIFDGGPILQGRRHGLRSFSSSLTRQVANWVNADDTPTTTYLVGNRRESGFRAVVVECARIELSDNIVLPPAAMRVLDVVTGDAVMCVRL